MRRAVSSLLAALALGAAVASIPIGERAGPATARADDGGALELQPLSRFGGSIGPTGLIDGLPAGLPRNPDLVPVVVLADLRACGGAETTWVVDGEAVRPSGRPARVPDGQGGARCEAILPVPQGNHQVSVEAAGGEVTQTGEISVRDTLIVALGDSVASGEGNPEPGRSWLEPRCHRSSAAGFEQAARVLSGADEQSVTFVSLACSGAGIDRGVLGKYGGVKPDGVLLESQVSRLGELEARREVKVVLVSVGANDIGFSDVAVRCANIDDCRGAFEDRVAAGVRALPAAYDRLAPKLKGAAPDAAVVISEYFDPTHAGDGDLCRRSLFFTDRAEALWAYESLLRPLNASIARAAVRHDWTLVPGIAADFRLHGICAKDERWVLTLGDSVAGQGDQLGTLHPNRRGHLAIANLVAPALAQAAGLTTPPERPDDTSADSRPLLERAWQVALFLVLAGAIALFFWLTKGLGLRDRLRALPVWAGLTVGGIVALPFLIVWRIARLARPTGREAPAPDDLPPPPRWRPPRNARGVAIVLAALLVAAVAVLLLARELGRAILWARYWAANLPADQAVDAVSNEELVTTGTGALGVFVVLGLLGMIGVWMLDRKGSWGPGTRLGLIAVVIAELLAAVLLLGDFQTRQELQILLGFLIVAPLAYFLVDRSIERAVREGKRAPRHGMKAGEIKDGEKKSLSRALRDQLRLLFGRSDGREPVFSFWLALPRAIPLFLLAVALWGAFTADGADRWLLIVLPYLAAAFLFVAPGGIAWRATADASPGQSTLEALEPPRVALALTGVTCICVLIYRDETWLFWAAAVAIGLAFFCLGIAAATGSRFAPFGLALLVSVPLFGATAVILRGIDSPELQPVAAILEDGRAVCGVYVGDSDDSLWIGQVQLAEQADVRRPTSSRSSITPYDDVREHAIGTLQPVGRATAQARVLRDRLRESAPGRRSRKVGPPACAADRPVEKPEPSPERKLAVRFQPELVVDRDDLFWPIPVTTLFAMQDRRAVACRQVRMDVDDGCVRLTSQGQFPWAGGEGEAIEYPAGNDNVGDQHRLMVDALGSIDPAKTAREYFLVAGDQALSEPLTLQYWFFYSFNYQPITDAPDYGGFHEGDFESIAILLSADSRQPRYIWMARHGTEEGRIYPWPDEAVQKRGLHPIVFAARGSHATYENCNDQVRVGIDTLIDDQPACADERALVLAPEVTPLTDLSRVSWGCWRGLFGHRQGGKFSDRAPVVNNGPKSPLWQQEFPNVKADPCFGIRDPGGREGQGEEVVEPEQGVPSMLRERAARLEGAVDECKDWEQPASSGVYLVACNQAELTRYADSGFETAQGARVRIDIARADKPRIGEPTLPAVRRQPTDAYFDTWRITTDARTEISVYASCRQDVRILEARFPEVPLEPGKPLQLDDGPGLEWSLLLEDGTPVASAPAKAKTIPSLTRGASGQGRRCSAG